MLYIGLFTYVASLFLTSESLSTRRSFFLRQEGTVKRGSMMILRAMESESDTEHPSDVSSWTEISSLATLTEVRTLLTLVQEENVEAVRYATISIDDGEEIARKNRRSLFGSGEVSEQMIHCFHKLDLWVTNLALDYVRTVYIRDNNKSPHITYLNEMIENIDSSQTLARLLQQSSNLRTSEAASLRYQRNNADHHTPGSPRHLVERLMFEGLKYSREISYNSNKRNSNSLKDESNRGTNSINDRNNDQTVINPSPNMKKSGSKKYGLSRQPDSWAKRIANSIEADKAAAAKNLGEKNSPAAKAVNNRNIDLLAIAQDVIDARALLCRNFGDKITGFLASHGGVDSLEASTLDTKSLLADVSINGGEDFVVNDQRNDHQEGRIALKNFHRSTVCLTLATPFVHVKNGVPSSSTIDRAIADVMNKRSPSSPQSIDGLNGNSVKGVHNNGVNNNTSPSFQTNYLNDDGSINASNNNNDEDNDTSMSSEFALEPDETGGVSVNAGAGYTVTEIDGVEGEEGLGKIVNDLIGSIFGGFNGASSGDTTGVRKGWRQEDGTQTKPDPDGVRVGVIDPPNKTPPRRPSRDNSDRDDDNDEEKRNPVDYGEDIPEGNIKDFYTLEGVRIRVVSQKEMSHKNTLNKADFGQKYLLLEGKSQPQMGPNGVMQVKVMHQWIKYEEAIAFLKSSVDETTTTTSSSEDINDESSTEQETNSSTTSDRRDKSPFMGGDIPMM